MKTGNSRAFPLVCIGLAALGVGVGTAPAEEPALHRFIEAEDCDGLLRYPYDNEEAKGWYGREANCRGYGAPGRTYCAAIHENAPEDSRSMSQGMTPPLPAGKYRLFLRVVGPHHRTPADETLVRVNLGGTTADFTWDKGSKRFRWLPGVDIELPTPAATVSFTAMKFGGNGHGTIYEPMNRSIWVDTLYITSDLTEKAGPRPEKEPALRGRVQADDLPERPAYRADDAGPSNQITPRPTGRVYDEPIRLEAFDGRKNRWPNSSFELGLNDGWASSYRAMRHIFTDADMDNKNPFHGTYCLRVPAGANPFSRPYYLPNGGRMTLSVHVRGEETTVSATLLHIEGDYKNRVIHDRQQTARKPALVLNGAAKAEWGRLSGTGELANGWYYLSVTAAREVWLDGIQLEEGDAAADFAPRAEVEAGLSTGQLGNITYEDQNSLKLWLHNSGKTAEEARVKYRIVDVRDRVVAEGTTEPMGVPAGKTAARDVAIVPALRGMFSVTYALEGRKLPEGELVFLRMPKPADKPTRHQLGANMSFDATELALHKRLGLKWALTCKTRVVGSAGEGVHPRPDEWNWHDDLAARPRQMGMDVIPCFWPGRIPEFMQQAQASGFRPSRGGYRSFIPEPDLWQDYVGKVAGHYREHIKSWCVDDESENAWDPRQHAEIVRLTSAAVRKAAPGVKIGVSAIADFTEEMLQHIPADTVDFFGGSTFDNYYWDGRKVRRMRERYGKPWVCYGVGNRTINTMYHTLYTYQPVWWNAARMARRVSNLFLVQGLEVAGHYAAVLRNDGAHIAKNKPLCGYDGTPLPWGGSFGCLGTLLAYAVEMGDVPLGDTGLRAHVFRNGDTTCAVTWATCRRSYDHHWRPSQRELSGVSLQCAQGTVGVLDMYWNERPDPRWEGGQLKLDLNEEPTFLMDRGLGEEQFIAMLRAAVAPPKEVDIGVAFVPMTNGKLGLEVTVKSNRGKKLKDVTVDLRPPGGRQPFSMAGDWLLAQPVGGIRKIGRRKSGTVILPTVIDGSVPYEAGQFRVNLRAKDGFEAASDEWLWLVPSARVMKAPDIDGNLGEWEGRSAAWLAYNWAWALFGRHIVQLHENGEYFSYPPYRIDARAAFWAGWDKENLYLAVRLDDDQPILSGEKRETVRVAVCSDNGETCAIDLRPTADGVIDAAVSGGRLQTGELASRSKAGSNRVELEVAIPWRGVAVEPKPGAVLRFDLFWTDADKENDEVVAGTLRWAGGESPTGFMLLRGE